MLNTRTRRVGVEALRGLMEGLLGAVGLEAEAARTVAGVHLEADLRGVGVQGLNHLINSHIQDFESGRIDPAGRPEVVREGAAFAMIDGHSGPGPLAALLAAEVAAKKAGDAGCAVVGVSDSNDLFQAGHYAELMARAGVVGFVFSDDVVPVVHPLGGVEPIIGSNPMAVGVPAEPWPFVIDFAPTATLPTTVRYTRRYGGRLPAGVATDADGRPTTDPDAVTDGSGLASATGAIDPLGNKGYGLLLLIDFLSGAFVGCDMGTGHLAKPGARKGHFFMAADPATFGDLAAFKRAVGARMAEIKGSRKAPGWDEIRMPGDRSRRARKAALRDGRVEIDELCWQDALRLAARLGVAVPA